VIVDNPDHVTLSSERVTGIQLIIHQVKGLIIKRFHHIRRDKVSYG